MSSGHWVNINTWQMDICWFKLKWKLLKGKKWGSYFLENKLAFMWFSLLQTPHRILQHCPSPPSLLIYTPPHSSGLWGSSAGLGLLVSPTWSPALQVWLQQETCLGRDFWRSVTQPPAPSKVSFKPEPGFSKPQGWRLHSLSGMLCQGCTIPMGKGWRLGAFSLKPEGISHCNSPPALLLSTSAASAERWREGTCIFPFHSTMATHPVCPYNQLIPESFLPVTHLSPQVQCFLPVLERWPETQRTRGFASPSMWAHNQPMTPKLNRHGGMTPASAWALLHWTFSFSCSEFGDLDTNVGAASPRPLVMGLTSIIPHQSKHCPCPWGSEPQRRFHK